MKIALLDLNHHTISIHTNTVPLGLGLLSIYLKNNIENPEQYDIKLFKVHEKLLEVLKTWIPDIVGITQYSWNSNLNIHMAQYILKLNPNCIIIAGGPNLHIKKEKKIEFLKRFNFIDFCITYEGEIPFLNIIKEISNGKKVNEIKHMLLPGIYALDGELLESDEPSPRISSLDVFGPIYITGIFDELLNDGFNPFLQTQRGCPNNCAYCHTGNKYYSKIIFQSPEIFKRDMEYLGKKFRNRHDISLYLANTNFGLYKKDFEIAEIIRYIQDKYDWPKHIDINYANNSKNLLKMCNMWKYKMVPAIALQTLTKKVMDNINRKNISLQEFEEFHDKVVKEYGNETWTELILCLPGEDKRSFLETLSGVFNSKVQIVCIYTLMLLNGTPLSDEDFIEKYNMKIKYRLVPRCFSEIEKNRIFDIEKVIVETNTMSYSEYLYFRKLSLLAEVFLSNNELFKYRVSLIDNKKDIMRYLIYIYYHIHKYRNISKIINDFMMETENELFNSEEELITFYSKDNSYKLLLEGKLGDNLLRKYKNIIINSHMDECKQIMNEYEQ